MTLKTNPKGPKHSHSLTLTPPSSQTPCVTLISFHSLPHSHLISLTSLKFQLNPRKCTHARTPLCQPPSSQFFFPSHLHKSWHLKLYASTLLDWVFFFFLFSFWSCPRPLSFWRLELEQRWWFDLSGCVEKKKMMMIIMTIRGEPGLETRTVRREYSN